VPAPQTPPIVSELEKFLGDTYVYGAAGPSTFDCSGLVQYVYRQLGVKVPRTSEEQYAATTRITESQLAPGDLVFSEGTSHPGHVAIFVGSHNGTPSVIEAPHTGAVVRYTPLDQFGATGYGRITGAAADAVNAGWRQDLSGALNDVTGAAGAAAGGLFSFPGEVVQFFSKATDDLVDVGQFFWAFTQPATWVRIGSGALASVLLIAGLYFLVRSGGEAS
jgi:hypothetical protein